jgi:predicted RNA-binding protein
MYRFLDSEEIVMKIIYTTESGDIAIIHPTKEWIPEGLPKDIEIFAMNNLIQKDVPKRYRSSAIVVDDDIIPNDRTFRGAWKHEDGKIVEDLDKSKEIHKEKLRVERKPLLEAQDVIYLKALEDGVDTKDIVTEKKRLRDITKLVDSCKGTVELRRISC